jgi:hypothetical protein
MTSLSSSVRWMFLAGAAVAATACTSLEEDTVGGGDAITSNDANLFEASFRGSVLAGPRENTRKAISTQLTYLQGALTTHLGGNAQAGMPALSNVESVEEDGKQRITYEVKLTFAVPKNEPAMTSYDVVLPLDTTKLAEFNQKYDGRCGSNEYGVESFWHDWNPKGFGCAVDDADVLRVSATLKPHPQTTEGKFPEYDKVWEDGSLDVVAVFGIIDSNTPYDEGARGREQLLASVASSLQNVERKDADTSDGILADSTVSGSITIAGQQRRVNVTGILVQEAATAGFAFNRRYAAATEKADVVVYEGHSGLGTNIDVLTKEMGATRGKYQLVYLYGCQTLGYLGPDMHAKRVELNGAEADPDGTKFLDVIATALPAYGDNGHSTGAIYEALLAPGQPRSFNDLLGEISSLHLSVVYGEHDNVFTPR